MKLKLCGWCGCNELVTSGYYCAKHKAIADQRKAERDRASWENMERVANYKTPEWRALSKATIKEVGCCQRCGATVRLQVHHVQPVRYHPELFLERSNLIVLCESCHRLETLREIRDRR